ncbi:MAG TPA: hypothetical protein VNR18_01220, partial [Hyphomicrobiales bacterium]|nr:hypothetical protein [Hyphomicrobiales bacterium]
TRADGSEVRLNVNGEPAPLTDAEIQGVIAQLPNQREVELLEREDSYYYGHKREAALPVWRVLMNDEGGTRLYIDRTTGSVRAVGSTGRLARWIRSGLHDMDFPVLRIRPIWDVVVGLLLLGVTSLCMIGTWLAIKRVRLDFKLTKVRWRRRLAEAAAARAASEG